jgi:hypothetical protein
MNKNKMCKISFITTKEKFVEIMGHSGFCPGELIFGEIMSDANYNSPCANQPSCIDCHESFWDRINKEQTDE